MKPDDLLGGYIGRHALAEAFGVTPRTITRWIAQPDGLPYVKVGSRTMFRVDAVREWLASRERHPNRRRAA